MRFSYSLLFVLCASLWVVSATRVYLELEQSVGPHSRSGWRVVRRCFPHDFVTLTFALKLQNVETLERNFWDISTPGSVRYRQHMSLADVQALTAPGEEARRGVEAWLRGVGVDVGGACRATGDFLECLVSCRTAEQLLDTRFFRYENEYNETVMRADKLYSVTSDVSPFLDFVGGTHRFPSRRLSPHFSSPKGLFVTPSVLRRQYNVSDNVGNVDSNKQCVAQFLNQHFSELDLKEFFLLYGESFTHKNSVDKVIGPDSGLSGGEASLDVEYIMSLGANISTWFWSTPGLHDHQEPFLEWIIAVGNTSDAPNVISVSYGDDEDSLSVSYMERINQEFMKQGVRGISILFASGDSGAGCKDDTVFVPNFPTSSPYVTSVGGTEFSGVFSNGEVGNYISGGGFSNVFSCPGYQQIAVQNFLNSSKHLPDAKFFNKTGRAYPDISALSDGFLVIADLLPTIAAGTSCASPTVAGIVALVNDRLLHAGKPVLGFLNPLLYQHQDAMNDITDGCNGGCEGTGFCSQSGWDPVTGNGVPNFPAFLKAALSV